MGLGYEYPPNLLVVFFILTKPSANIMEDETPSITGIENFFYNFSAKSAIPAQPNTIASALSLVIDLWISSSIARSALFSSFSSYTACFRI